MAILRSGATLVLQSGTSVITKWDRCFVLRSGTDVLCYEVGQMFCVTKWDRCFVLRSGTDVLCYEVGQIFCVTKWGK